MTTAPTSQQIYSMSKPLATHWREVTCKEVDCPHWLMGWETFIDEGSDFGQAQAAYIRHQSGRRCRERLEGPMTVFTFWPEQRCFRSHKMALERAPELSRTASGQRQIYRDADAWMEDFNDAMGKAANAKLNGR